MASITIDIDEKLKSQAESLFADLGMDMQTAITIFFKQSVQEQRLPFSVSRDDDNNSSDYNDKTKEAIRQTLRDMPNISIDPIMRD